MTNVDHERFRPQQALSKVKGRAEGNCFTGVSAVSQGPNGIVAVIVAKDVETLEIAWDDISIVPLDRAGVQHVAIFSQDAMTPNAEVRRATARDTMTEANKTVQSLGLASTTELDPVAPDRERVPTPPFAVFDEFGIGADDRVQDYAAALVAAERERWRRAAEEMAKEADHTFAMDGTVAHWLRTLKERT